MHSVIATVLWITITPVRRSQLSGQCFARRVDLAQLPNNQAKFVDHRQICRRNASPEPKHFTHCFASYTTYVSI